MISFTFHTLSYTSLITGEDEHVLKFIGHLNFQFYEATVSFVHFFQLHFIFLIKFKDFIIHPETFHPSFCGLPYIVGMSL